MRKMISGMVGNGEIRGTEENGCEGGIMGSIEEWILCFGYMCERSFLFCQNTFV